MNKKHNNTDPWLAQHCTLHKTDQKRNTQRKKQRDSHLDPRVLRSVCSNVCASVTARHQCSAGVFHIKKCQVKSGQGQMRIGQGNWRGCARRRVDGIILVIVCWRRIRRHSRLWRCQLQRVNTSRSRSVAHALEVRSAMVDCEMTFKVVCEKATRRGAGRVRHLDARLLWLQQLCVEGVVEVRAWPGERNEAYPGMKVVDLTRF